MEFIEHCVLNRNANPLSSTPLACLKLDEMHCLMGHAITSCCIDFYHNRWRGSGVHFMDEVQTIGAASCKKSIRKNKSKRKNKLTPEFYKRALLNYWGVSNQPQTCMDERPIWVHQFSRKKPIPHGSIHLLPQHILLVNFRTVKTKMMIKSSFFFQKLNSIDR